MPRGFLGDCTPFMSVFRNGILVRCDFLEIHIAGVNDSIHKPADLVVSPRAYRVSYCSFVTHGGLDCLPSQRQYPETGAGKRTEVEEKG